MKIRLIISVIISLLLQSSIAFAQKKTAVTQKPFTVVIDAGHGGHDPGAIGAITQEKTLNLNVSLGLGKMIQEGCPEVKVVYTRSTDVFLTLQERANKVNKNAADLFICIHTNSAKSATPKGAETFVLGIDKMASNLDVAMRENSVILLEDDYKTTYQGFDPNSVESYIMFELMQDQYMEQSLQYADLVQQEFAGIKRTNRGVRQAGFWVLHKSACPSVLVEMGFISNPEEERYLASKTGQAAIVQSLYNAFLSYKKAYDKKHNIKPTNEETSVDDKKSTKKEDKTNIKKEEKQTTSVAAKELKDSIQTTKQDTTKNQKMSSSAQSNGGGNVEKTDLVKTDSVVVEKEEKIRFCIQIFVVSKPLKSNDPTFKGLKDCSYTISGKYFKYTYGSECDYSQIQALHQQIKTKFPDSFIVAFKGNRQITVKEALAALRK